MAKPTGMKKRPMATQKAGNVCSAGSTANFMIAAATKPPAAPSANAIAPPKAISPLGDSNSSMIATRTSASTPFGQAVATQKSSIAPIARNAGAALGTAGIQSGPLSGKGGG